MNELKEIKNALSSLNASPNAIKFYLASYRTGKSTIGKIALSCSMDRSSAYLAYDQLKTMGLMEEDLESKRKTVWTRPPKAVISRLRTEIRRMRGYTENIDAQMPELLAAYGEKDSKPILQLFSGKDGLHQIIDDVLENTDGELLLFTNQTEEKKVFTKKDHEEFIKTRINKHISARVLASNTPEAQQLKRTDKSCLRETRIIDEQDPFKSETYIYGDRVAMLSFDKEIIGFIVRSKDFADAQRWMFKEIWQKYGE